MVISRRSLLVGAVCAVPAWLGAQVTGADWEGRLRRGVTELERKHGGRLGVAMLDTATMRRFSHRGDERFALCSTWKLLAAGCVLQRVDRNEESLNRRVVYGNSDLVAWSPATSKHTGGTGMTVGDLCEAALTLSDNTAANLLLKSFGGPPAITAFARSLGDPVTRLDRWETILNENLPGDVRDSTTPVAMLEDVHKVVLGDVLSAASRRQLIAWLQADKVGAHRLRAGVPNDWRVGDKTGTGDRQAMNDAGVLWPPHGAPIIVTVYYTGARAPDAEREAVIASVGRLAAEAFA